jgi:DNA-binding SARP family transcriptional activator
MLHVSLLGEKVISDAAGILRTPTSRSIALVAFLVLHAEVPQSRQRIAALFWPDSTDEQALTNLRRELHHLRHALRDAPGLVVTSKHLCWRDDDACRVDVRVFATEREAAMAARAAGHNQAFLAHASAALDQYRGEFLPGAHEDWQLQARAELEQQCVDLPPTTTAPRCWNASSGSSPRRRRARRLTACWPG